MRVAAPQEREGAEMSEVKRGRLLIELVPKTCWFSNLRSELPPVEWKKLSRAQRNRDRHRCRACGLFFPNSEDLECHERWSYDIMADGRRVQALRGLVTLCRSCHEVKHFGLAALRGRSSLALAHLRDVNDWDEDRAEDHLRESFERWSERSSHEWDLDLSWLKERDFDPRFYEREARLRRQESWRKRAGEEEIPMMVGEALDNMARDLGPCPEGASRFVVVHDSCRHATGVQVKTPETEQAKDFIRDLRAAMRVSPCADCAGLSDLPASPSRERAVERPPGPGGLPGPEDPRDRATRPRAIPPRPRSLSPGGGPGRGSGRRSSGKTERPMSFSDQSPPPRHPLAPCDEMGRPVRVVAALPCGIALVEVDGETWIADERSDGAFILEFVTTEKKGRELLARRDR